MTWLTGCAGAFVRSVVSMVLLRSTNREIYAAADMQSNPSRPGADGTRLPGTQRWPLRSASSVEVSHHDDNLSIDNSPMPRDSVLLCRFANGNVGPVEVCQTASLLSNS
jgi:hypothetical protein